MQIKNIAFYSFFKPSFDLQNVRQLLYQCMCELQVKGTILLGVEGINCSLSAEPMPMDEFLNFLFDTIKIVQPDLKISYSNQIAFKRSLVKIKPHIVAKPGKTPLDLSKDAAPYLSAQELHQWMNENKAMVLLDTRNDYEFKAGHFKNAVHLGAKHFADFEADLQKAPEDWKNIPIVTFCTGGIRCEKAAPLMIKKGFRQVYQLQGGILNYFEKIGRGFYEGECFVFDERMGLNEKLNPV